MKFLVLSLLVLGANAVPITNTYGAGYGSGYGSGYGGSLTVSAPKTVVVGGSYGSGSYGSGSYGVSGLRSGYGVSGLSGYGSGLSTGYSSGLNAGYGTYGSGLGYSGQGIAVNTVPVTTGAIGYSNYGSGISSGVTGGLSSGLAAQNFLTIHQGQNFEQVVPAAIQQISRTVEYRPYANQEQPIQAQIVEIEPSDNPVHLHFKTRSSTLSTSQSHVAAGPTEVQTAAAQDEPQRLITEVQKPVIQEVKEVISPFRQVTQEINPVVESLHTIVTKGEGYRQQYQGANIGAQYQSGQQYQTGFVAPSSHHIAVAKPVTIGAVHNVAVPVQSVAVKPFGGYSGGYQSSFSAPVSTGFQSTYSAPATSHFGSGSSSFNSNSFAVKPAQSSFSTYSAPSSSSSFNSFSVKPASVQSSSYVAPSSSSSSFSSFGSKPAVSKIGASFSSSSDTSAADSY